VRASKARTFYFYRSTIAPPPPFAPHTLANFKSLTKLIIAPSTPFGAGGMFIHIVGAIGKSPLLARACSSCLLLHHLPLWGRGIFIHIVGAIGKSPSPAGASL